MLQYQDFYFDGEYSTVKGVFNANNSDGLYEQTSLAERNVLVEMTRNQPKGYFMNLTRNPFKFTLKIGSQDDWTREKLDEIISWFDVDYFKEFYFVDELDRRFFVMPSGSPSFTHNGNGKGFLTIEMTSQSPFSFSPRYVTNEYNFSANTDTGTKINFNNGGHDDLYPMIRIRKVGDGNISIKNETNMGRLFEIRNLANTEEVFIDNQTKEIVSNFPRTYHYDDHNGIWLSLVKGNNSLQVFGTCYLEFEYRYRYSPTL